MMMEEGKPSQLSPLKQAFLRIEELEEHLRQQKRVLTEPVAIVGIACRFPGGADTPEKYWQLLKDGADAIDTVPADRWDIDAYYDPDPSTPGTMSTRWGGFLDNVSDFDPDLFGIAPREARMMDPQQRLLLEVSWEALENGGIAPKSLEGTRLGVFVGICTNEWAMQRVKCDQLEGFDGYLASGMALSIASGRISYVLGVQGPSMTLDTACSSSLVAIHQACRSLRTGECPMAIAGGVNVLLAPEITVALTKSNMMAPDGRCKTFDSRADGYVRGEGCGVLVLKRLADALRDRDLIHAVIRGSAVNQDGPSSGLTVPNGPAQVDVIRRALADGGVDPLDVGYVEAHGTGTSLGDPIEVQALGAALGRGRTQQSPLRVGAVKTNFGHLESAAGVAGVIKVALSMQHRQLPPSLHFEHPNPHIPWSDLPISVVSETSPFPSRNGRRIAGVSSFGFSGTNAHLVLEQAPEPDESTLANERPLHILTLSAKRSDTLDELVDRYSAHLEHHREQPLANVCFTANSGRSPFSERLAVVGRDADEIRNKLRGARTEESVDGVWRGTATGPDKAKIAFLFTGQGSQYIGMGRGLYETQPTFRRVLDECEEILRPELELPLLSVVFGDEHQPLLNQTAYTQPALFSLEYGLAQLWKSWGIQPHVVLGHSIGEYVAACLAGVVSLEHGLRLIAARGRLMQSLPSGGAMAAVFTDEGHVRDAINGSGGTVSVAALNGPANVVVSGAEPALDEVLQKLAAQGVATQRLAVSHAFHSSLMEPMLNEFERLAQQLQYGQPRIRMISNVTGDLLKADEPIGAAYWCQHVRSPVRFYDGIQTLDQTGVSACIELGPHPTLLGMATSGSSESAKLWLPTLRRGRDDWGQLLESVARMTVGGIDLDWNGFDRDYARRRVSLPTYPFHRQRYWPDQRTSISDRRKPNRKAEGHPLLGSCLRSPVVNAIVFNTELNLESFPYLADHQAYGMVVAPATLYLEMAWAAANQAFGSGSHSLHDVEIREVLAIPESDTLNIQLVLTPVDDGRIEFQWIQMNDEHSWKVHSTGSILLNPEQAVADDTVRLGEVQSRCQTEVETRQFYSAVSRRGIDFGESFQGVVQLWRGESEALARVEPPTTLADTSDYVAHPAILDACLQPLAAALFSAQELQDGEGVYMPVGVEHFRVLRPLEMPLWSHFRIHATAGHYETQRGDVRVFDVDGNLVAELNGLQLKRADQQTLQRVVGRELQDWFYTVEWKSQPRSSNPSTGFASPGQLADSVRPKIEELSNQHSWEQYDELQAQLDGLCFHYIDQALRRLGWQPKVGDKFTLPSLSDSLGVVRQQHRLLHRFLEILREEGCLAQTDSEWEVLAIPESRSGSTADALLNQFPQGSAEISFAQRGGQHLSDCLRGAEDPLEVLFPNGSFDLADQLYRESPAAVLINGLAREVISEILSTTADDRRLRVLEIGAGTGGTASFILDCFPPDRTEYQYTDVSPLFLSKAKDRFSNYPFLRFGELDIEADPVAQGYNEPFDLVIAANVLHATSDLESTLRNVRSLLAPGGLLVAIEATTALRWIDVSFGLTEGWWKFTDWDLRPSYPLIPGQKWVDVLNEARFARGVHIPQHDTRGALAHNVLVVAQTAEEAVDRTPPSSTEPWILLCDRTGTGEALAAELQSRGQTCVICRHASSFLQHSPSVYKVDLRCPEHYSRLFAELLNVGHTRCKGVIHLTSLDTSWREDADATELDDDLQFGCKSALHLIQAMLATPLTNSSQLWLITRGAQPLTSSETLSGLPHSSLWGFGKVTALEHPELRCVNVDLDPASRRDTSRPDATRQAEVPQGLIDELLDPSGEDQIGFRNDRRYVARLVRLTADHLHGSTDRPSQPQRLTITEPGVLDRLSFVPTQRPQPAAGEVEIKVHATGLIFRDVLLALGMIPGDDRDLGGECSGTISAVGEGVVDLQIGDEVVGLARESFGTYAVAPAKFLVPKPKDISFEEAATIPSSFVTAYYALHRRGEMKLGERVLIHSAAGGVGQAAVQLAQLAGARIFATAGSPAKRDFLRSQGIEHVLDSRSLDFAEEIARVTNGEGVDIVLNSLADDFIQKSVECLKVDGRFLELGKRGVWDDERVKQLRADATFHLIDLSVEAPKNPQLARDLLEKISKLIKEGHLSPLSFKRFAMTDVKDAFRYMATAKHIGKVVVSHGDDLSESRIREEGTYLITGGLGGLGLAVAIWMVERGARNLVLVGRSEPSAEADRQLTAMRKQGASVVVYRADVSQAEDVQRVFASIGDTMPSLRGIVHAAGLLDDGTLLQQEWSRFENVFAPKVSGSWNLHRATSKLDLDFFILFSSVASMLGSPGQSNHAAANAFLDALAYYRRSLGLCASSINWGAWADIGAAAKRRVGARIVAKGMDTFSPDEGLECFARLLQEAPVQAGVMPVNWNLFCGQQRTNRGRYYLENLRQAQPDAMAEQASQTVPAILHQIHAALGPRKKRQILLDHVRSQAAQVLGLDSTQTLLEEQPLREIGLDSLMAVELRNLLGKNLAFESPLPSTIVFDYPTVADLTDFLLDKVVGHEATVADAPSRADAGADASATDLVLDLEQLSDDEVERRLAKRVAREKPA